MADETTGASAKTDDNEQNPTIGGPTAQAKGFEYQIVSKAGREAIAAGDQPGSTDSSAENRADAGRDPEYYAEKHIPEGAPTDTGKRNQPTTGEIGERGGVISRAGHGD